MKAIIFNLLAWVMLPIMDGFAKYLSADLPVLQITWARYFFTVAFTFPVMFFFFRKDLVWTDKPKLQFIRGLILLTANICFFYAISKISLAKALTLAFVAPIIVTILSSLLLKEKVGLNRWCAVTVGFIGALIIIQPGIIKLNLASLAGIGTGISYAFYLISTRSLTAIDSPFLTLIFTGLFGAIIISFIVPFYWTTPNINQWIIMICLAAVGTLGHFLLILSLKYAEASKLAPLAYFEIVNNIIIGYYFFGDFPNRSLWIGLFFIISSGVYISFRDNKKSKIFIMKN